MAASNVILEDIEEFKLKWRGYKTRNGGSATTRMVVEGYAAADRHLFAMTLAEALKPYSHAVPSTISAKEFIVQNSGSEGGYTVGTSGKLGQAVRMDFRVTAADSDVGDNVPAQSEIVSITIPYFIFNAPELPINYEKELADLLIPHIRLFGEDDSVVYLG